MTKAAELAKMGEVLTNSQIGGRRNIIINGAMEVAQRGTSASSKTASDYYTCDRWRTEASGATFNTSQQSNSASDMATTGAKHFLRMEVTTANNNSGISQKIEAKNIRQFKGEKLTLSFYAKGTNPNGGSFDVVRQFDDGSTTSTQEKSSLTVTSSFVKYTYTFDYPDEGSVTMTDANAKMALSFLQPNGDTSTNAWTLDITSVQLEVGSKATPFEHRSFGEELALCHRYFRRYPTTSYIATLQAYSSSATYGPLIQINPEMRASVSVSSSGNFRIFKSNSQTATNGEGAFSGLTRTQNSPFEVIISGGPTVDGASGLTAGHASVLSGTSGSYIDADAEL
jgi:hypothetical protein